MKTKCEICATRVPWVCFFGNATLAIFKVFVGLLSGSKGLVADGMHSASDVVATGMILITLNIAKRKDDKTHPWGHGKIEFVGAMFVYTILLCLSIYLFHDALISMIAGNRSPPHIVGFLAAGISILANFILSGYGFCAGRHLNSPALIANANENRADMLSSVAVVIGIVGANMGYVFMDSLAAILVALIIFKTALTLWLQAYKNLIDVSLPAEKAELVKKVALEYRDVKGVNYIKSRRVGQSVWVDMEIFVDARKNVREAHMIVRELRLALIRRFKHIKDVSVTFSCKESAGKRKNRTSFAQAFSRK